MAEGAAVFYLLYDAKYKTGASIRDSCRQYREISDEIDPDIDLIRGRLGRCAPAVREKFDRELELIDAQQEIAVRGLYVCGGSDRLRMIR